MIFTFGVRVRVTFTSNNFGFKSDLNFGFRSDLNLGFRSDLNCGGKVQVNLNLFRASSDRDKENISFVIVNVFNIRLPYKYRNN